MNPEPSEVALRGSAPGWSCCAPLWSKKLWKNSSNGKAGGSGPRRHGSGRGGGQQEAEGRGRNAVRQAPEQRGHREQLLALEQIDRTLPIPGRDFAARLRLRENRVPNQPPVARLLPSLALRAAKARRQTRRLPRLDAPGTAGRGRGDLQRRPGSARLAAVVAPGAGFAAGAAAPSPLRPL